MISFIRRHLAVKLFISYLVIILAVVAHPGDSHPLYRTRSL